MHEWMNAYVTFQFAFPCFHAWKFVFRVQKSGKTESECSISLSTDSTYSSMLKTGEYIYLPYTITVKYLNTCLALQDFPCCMHASNNIFWDWHISVKCQLNPSIHFLLYSFPHFYMPFAPSYTSSISSHMIRHKSQKRESVLITLQNALCTSALVLQKPDFREAFLERTQMYYRHCNYYLISFQFTASWQHTHGSSYECVCTQKSK